MTTAQERRAAASAELVRIAAEWRGQSMPVKAQHEFDAHARDIDAADAEIAAEAAQAAEDEAAEVRRREAGPTPPPLADRFKGYRVLESLTDRAVAKADIQSLAARCRGRSWTDDEQLAFDRLVYAVEVYDAECAERAAAPPPPTDPRDGILDEMRARAGNAPPQPAATTSYWDAVRAQGQACRRSRIN